MAFSHINLDAPGAPPGPSDTCPCGSCPKSKRCCGVDRWRFLPLRGRRRGVTPADLAERVDDLARDFAVRFLARTFLPARLGGLSLLPSAIRSARSCASCFASSASSSTRRSRSLSGSATAGCEAVGLAHSARTGSGAASVWSGWWASCRGRSRSDCRARRTRTVTAATVARTSTASWPALRRRSALPPRAKVEHPRPVREHQHSRIPDRPAPPHVRPTERALKRTKCPAERPAALRGLTAARWACALTGR